jgi:GNAT superfamily N-acetyltransferase
VDQRVPPRLRPRRSGRCLRGGSRADAGRRHRVADASRRPRRGAPRGGLPCAGASARPDLHCAGNGPRAAGSRRHPAEAGRHVRDFLDGLEIELASAAWTEAGAARRRADAASTFERRLARPGGEWLALLDGEPVAWASAIAGPRGLYLAGGATLPAARGRGCYRALVRARWDEAVRRGTPALAVGAQDSSRPILERCGFEAVCTMYEVESDP